MAGGSWVTVHQADGSITHEWKEAPGGYDLFGQKQDTSSIPLISTPSLPAAPIQPLAPISAPAMDPLLSTGSILQQGQAAATAAAAPVDPTKFIAPGAMDLLTKGVNEQANINKASAQSTFGARGLTGSSTEVQTLTRDIPAQANQALAEGTVKLLQAAYPLAIEDKRMIVDSMYKTTSLSQSMRQLIGDESFKNLSLQQQRELANQDTQLKLTLADVEMRFQAKMKEAEFAFTAAENDKDRAAAQQQFEYLKSERNKDRTGAFIKSLTAIAGVGIGFATGGVGGAILGGLAGNVAGDAFGGLFTMG